VLEYGSIDLIISLRGQFGSVAEGLDTLCQTVTGGILWGEVADTLEKVSPVFRNLLIFYVVFVTLGMFNVVTGLFTTTIANLTSHDAILAVHNELHVSNSFAAQLAALLRETRIGRKNKDSLTEQEFIEFIHDPDVCLYLQTHEIDTHEAIELFHILDGQQNGEVTIEQFVFGCQRLKGVAKGIDVVMLFEQVNLVRDKLFESKEKAAAGFNGMQMSIRKVIAEVQDMHCQMNELHQKLTSENTNPFR
jgi:Ca2+-binding EF-hand superfamily protein